MSRPVISAVVALALAAGAVPLRADALTWVPGAPGTARFGAPAVVSVAPLACPRMVSPLALAATSITGPPEPPRARREKAPKTDDASQGGVPLGPERARILLRSLTIPGWGQATLGARRSGLAFAIAEASIWGAYSAFRIQDAMRTDAYVKTASLFAGINLKGRDDEFLRIVGSFSSSDQYNLLVVARDAANLYLSDPSNPDLVDYRQYLADHSLSGANAWRWADEAAFARYRSQRRDAQRAALRANTALGIAIANRLVSALHAARVAGHARPASSHAIGLDVEQGTDDPLSFRAGLRASF